MRKVSIAIVVVGLVIAGLAGLLWGRLQASRHTESEVATSAAQEIIRANLEWAAKGYKSPDGAVIAVISRDDAKFEPYNWFDAPHGALWKYQNGLLEAATASDVEEIKKNRNAPLYLIVVRQIEKGAALADIVVRYAKSSTVDFSGGGYASHWRMEFKAETWVVVEKDDYIFWD